MSAFSEAVFTTIRVTYPWQSAFYLQVHMREAKNKPSFSGSIKPNRWPHFKNRVLETQIPLFLSPGIKALFQGEAEVSPLDTRGFSMGLGI